MNTARGFKFGVNFITVLERTRKIAATAQNFIKGARNFGGAK
ncbi:hypothetical protein [Campylobacter sp.]|nr:hypothetical protein [Campylobacter sp.]